MIQLKQHRLTLTVRRPWSWWSPPGWRCLSSPHSNHLWWRCSDFSDALPGSCPHPQPWRKHWLTAPALSTFVEHRQERESEQQSKMVCTSLWLHAPVSKESILLLPCPGKLFFFLRDGENHAQCNGTPDKRTIPLFRLLLKPLPYGIFIQVSCYPTIMPQIA